MHRRSGSWLEEQICQPECETYSILSSGGVNADGSLFRAHKPGSDFCCCHFCVTHAPTHDNIIAQRKQGLLHVKLRTSQTKPSGDHLRRRVCGATTKKAFRIPFLETKTMFSSRTCSKNPRTQNTIGLNPERDDATLKTITDQSIKVWLNDDNCLGVCHRDHVLFHATFQGISRDYHIAVSGKRGLSCSPSHFPRRGRRKRMFCEEREEFLE